MTVQELKLKLIEAINEKDRERAHGMADDALIEFLNSIDPEIGQLYDQVEKWYA